ncbi:MAG: cation-translocating P-type ATPase [Actinomycetota bacterium]
MPPRQPNRGSGILSLRLIGRAGASSGNIAHRQPRESVMKQPRVDSEQRPGWGLDPEEVSSRLSRYGRNEIPPARREGWVMRLLRQLREPMAVLLLVAAAVSAFGLGERVDAAAIAAIVALNAVIGFVQEGRAARALEALRSMETPVARVVRGGRIMAVSSAEIVPGDAVLLSAGDRVPADLELVEAESLEIDESVLTGESLPVSKRAGANVSEDAPLAEQVGKAFSGTLVARGAGRGVVQATGPRTAVGALAEQLRRPQARTPLQIELSALTARLGTIAVAVAVGVFGLTMVRMGTTAEGIERAFLSAVALAVAAVPEGLATVVTVALALGVRRMAARGGIVRRLPAVETLGSTTVILTDKTGTLTENRMWVETVLLPSEGPLELPDIDDQVWRRVARAAVLCNDAAPGAGDPIDVALLEAFGSSDVDDLRRELPRIASVPFEAQRRRMATLHRAPAGMLLLVKGAPEAVLPRCAWHLGAAGEQLALTDDDRRALEGAEEDLAARGRRMLALAGRSLDTAPDPLEDGDRDLILYGVLALRDPVRHEATAAVAEARSAGIRIVMVTGDHGGTASAVARDVGLASPEEGLLTGRDLRESGLPADPLAVSVYARVDPDQKLALVEAARSRGQVVAVTGDGVNDAPALRRADIGVAMGRTGSDVAREAADLVVTDDNLATIVTAVREGRGIYDNIRKVVDYLVGGNLSEITVVVVSLLLFPGLGVPLLPLQLLWVNLLTDGLPALALGVDPVDPGLMRRPPRPRGDRLLRGARLSLLSVRGLLMGASAIASLAVARFAWDEPWPHARATMFTVLVAAHLLYAFVARLPTRRANPWLLGAVAAGLALQAAVVLLPVARPVFHTAFLSAREWLLVAAGAAIPIVLMLVVERWRKRRG